MATAKKISALTAVTVPAGSDVLAVKQGSTTKKLTVTQILSLAVAAALGTVSQSAAEAGTSTTRKVWTAQRVKQAIAALASGGTSWETITSSDTIAAGEGFQVVDGGGTVLVTIASTIAAQEEFTIHNNSDGTGTVSIEPNTGHTIKGPFGSALGGTDTVLMAPGETIKLLAVSTAVLEII